MKICPKCLCGHAMKGTYCSRKCANSRCFSEESKQKKSLALSGRKNPRESDPQNKELRKCLKCGAEFVVYCSSHRKYCSKDCCNTSGRMRGKSGGYRERSGRGLSGKYKGIHCGSTYELVWVIYNLDHCLPVKRFEGSLYDGKLRYFPDFVVGNHIIEIKGYWTQGVENKRLLAILKGYTIDILYKKDLKKCFDWVEKTYKTKKFSLLYD